MELIVLGSGSSGNTSILRCGETAVMIDAGLGPRKTLARLDAAGIPLESITAILLTHEHGDHAGGLPSLLRHLNCPVYATRLTAEEVRGQDPRNAAASWQIFSSGSTFCIGSAEVTAFSVPHDAADPVGFTIRANGTSLGILTDLVPALKVDGKYVANPLVETQRMTDEFGRFVYGEPKTGEAAKEGKALLARGAVDLSMLIEGIS